MATEEDQVSQTLGLDTDETITIGSPPATMTASTGSIPTRTVAIIKNHALQHRFDIEARISEAGFEIVKERQMEFDVETDPDTLVELFGDDAYSFSEGPVWVYVLERRRAVEVWQTLMGHADPTIAKATAPTSLRALYGLSATQNGIMGSHDGEGAEIQIASLFASSPPFPVTDLPDVNGARAGAGGAYNMDSMRSVASDILSSLAAQSEGEPSSTANGSDGAGDTTILKPRISNGSGPLTNTNGAGSGFKARAVPTTNSVPSIKPRMSRAAALRAGLVEVEDKSTKVGPRAPVSKDRLAQTFANVPGHGYRTTKIKVASTAAPSIVPRMTKAAALRLGIAPEQRKAPRPRASTVGAAGGTAGSEASTPVEKKGTFDGVPGHKRRESISVASTRAPSVAPRLNRAASLRTQKSEGAPPPSSFGMRGAAPSLSRSNSRSSLAGSSAGLSSSNRPPTISRSSSVASAVRRVPGGGGGGPPPSSYTHRPSASVAVARPGSRTNLNLTVPTISRSASNASLASQTASERSPLDGGAPSDAEGPAPRRMVRRPSSTNAPSIVPRPNKAAALRAAKMAEQMKTGIKVDHRKSLSTF